MKQVNITNTIKLKGSNSNSYVNIDRKMIKWNAILLYFYLAIIFAVFCFVFLFCLFVCLFCCTCVLFLWFFVHVYCFCGFLYMCTVFVTHSAIYKTIWIQHIMKSDVQRMHLYQQNALNFKLLNKQNNMLQNRTPKRPHNLTKMICCNLHMNRLELSLMYISLI